MSSISAKQEGCPPSRIPTEQEAREREEEQRKAAEQARLAEEAAKKAAEEAQRRREEEARPHEIELALLSSGVSAAPASPCPLESAAKAAEQAVKEKCDATMSRAHFCDTPDTLVAQAKGVLQAADRAFVLVQAPTTSNSAFGHLLEVAKQASDWYIGGTGSPGDQTKVRIVILVGRRYDLLAKAEDRGRVLWPKWSQTVVQLKKKARSLKQ